MKFQCILLLWQKYLNALFLQPTLSPQQRWRSGSTCIKGTEVKEDRQEPLTDAFAFCHLHFFSLYLSSSFCDVIKMFHNKYTRQTQFTRGMNPKDCNSVDSEEYFLWVFVCQVDLKGYIKNLFLGFQTILDAFWMQQFQAFWCCIWSGRYIKQKDF